MAVTLTGDASVALDLAGRFLETDPVRHNVILTLLRGRAAAQAEGRYLVAANGTEVVGVVFQSPLTFIATLTPMSDEVVDACVGRIVEDGRPLPGVGGEAGTAARFAGAWTERTKSAAVPEEGQRIYEATSVTERAGVPGALRLADEADRELLASWLRGFHDDTRESLSDPEETVRRRVAAGEFYVWDDGGPRSMAAHTPPVAGVSRVQAVYTPPELRAHGYASACVARLTTMVLESGSRCILYTDLGNPVSNSIYRRMGYRVAAEALRYRFA